jgi:hypothetical protein
MIRLVSLIDTSWKASLLEEWNIDIFIVNIYERREVVLIIIV